MTFAQAIEIPATDNVVLRGLRWPGDQDLVILLHDARESADLGDWNALIPFLLDQNVGVLAVDLRGHGASDGEWAPDLAAGDIEAIVRYARREAEACIVIIAAGASGIAALVAIEGAPVDGAVLLSAELNEDEPTPRGAGAAKLLIAGVADPAYKSALDRLRAASIGWALAVNLPTALQSVELLSGPWASHVRDHILAFLRERRYLSGGKRAGSGRLPGTFLEQIGLRPTGGRQ
jgi:pimeloyl-ACP methyl ester carboxylesterase